MKKTTKIQISTLILVLVLWEAIARSGMLIPEVFPPFSEVLRQLFLLMMSGMLWPHISTTLYEIITGFLAGGVIGLFLGGVMGVSNYLYRLLEPLFYYFSAIPKIILFPILLLFLGTGMESKMGMAAVSAFFPIVVNTALSVMEVKPIYIRAARIMGANRWQIYFKIYLPAMFGPILSGLRLGMGVAITGALLAETVVARAGLGHEAINFYSQLRIAEMYALILLIFVGAFLVNAFISALIRKVTHYQGDNSQNLFS